MRISDWSSDVCSSDLPRLAVRCPILSPERPMSACAPPEARVAWPDNGSSRIPFGVYTAASLHASDMQRLFYQEHWTYVGLETAIQQHGDFKRTANVERSVILLRDPDGTVRLLEKQSPQPVR